MERLHVARRCARLVLLAAALAGASVVVAAPRADASPASSVGRDAVSMVGDSLTAGSTTAISNALAAAGWDSVIDAHDSRGVKTKVAADPNTGLTAVDSIRARAGDTDVWVVALGTNDAGLYAASQYDDVIRTMLDRIGAGHVVVWVNIYLPRSPNRQREWNEALERVAAERPDELLIYDWASDASQHTGWLASDGVHYTGTGYAQRAQLVAQAVSSLVGDLIASQIASPSGQTTVQVQTTSDGAGFSAIGPRRVGDTRSTAPLEAGQVQTIDLSDVVPTGTTAAAVNITAAGGQAAAYVTAWACDAPEPTTSTLNHTSDRDVAVHAIVDVSADRTICVTTSSTVHVVVDVFGAFSPDGSLRLHESDPARLLDTRTNGATTVAAGQVVRVGTGLAVGDALALNVTVADATADGYTTVWPCGDARPATSVLNYDAGDAAISNVVQGAVGENGDVCIMSNSEARM